MDNREAIEILEANYPDACFEQLREAVDMAISALRTQEVRHSTESSLTQKGLDTINRQAAIDVIFNEPLYKSGMKKRDADVVVPAIYEGIKSLPSAQPEQRWIPCSERLPEEKDAGILKKLGTSKRSDYVLATVEVKDERMTVTTCTYDGAWYWDKKYAFPDYKVIAWMPLPEPYRKDGD